MQLRYEPCDGTGVCQVPADGERRRSELEFIPSEDISGLGIRFIIIQDGQASKAYERAISDSEVQGGQRYQVNSLSGASEKLKGKKLTIQYMLYRVEDDDVEICVEADFEVV